MKITIINVLVMTLSIYLLIGVESNSMMKKYEIDDLISQQVIGSGVLLEMKTNLNPVTIVENEITGSESSLRLRRDSPLSMVFMPAQELINGVLSLLTCLVSSVFCVLNNIFSSSSSVCSINNCNSATTSDITNLLDDLTNIITSNFLGSLTPPQVQIFSSILNDLINIAGSLGITPIGLSCLSTSLNTVQTTAAPLSALASAFANFLGTSNLLQLVATNNFGTNLLTGGLFGPVCQLLTNSIGNKQPIIPTPTPSIQDSTKIILNSISELLNSLSNGSPSDTNALKMTNGEIIATPTLTTTTTQLSTNSANAPSALPHHPHHPTALNRNPAATNQLKFLAPRNEGQLGHSHSEKP